jgi:putative phage-type endonuclease
MNQLVSDINTFLENDIKITPKNINEVSEELFQTLSQFHDNVNKKFIKYYIKNRVMSDNITFLNMEEMGLIKQLEMINKYKKNTMINRVKMLMEIPQPEQRSQAWYDMRYNMCTASDIGGIMEISKYSKRLDVLRKKCGLTKFTGNKFTRHGQCFEEIAVQIYELRYDKKVLEFGLLPHPTIPILGASPDGITTDGIMVEIKCPATRRIDGRVKSKKTLGYWAQMQTQLEVCDLEYCDFLECKIVEFSSYEDYIEDKYDTDLLTLDIIPPVINEDFIKVPMDRRNHLGLEKGVLGVFCDYKNEEVYLYPPFTYTTEEQLNWIDSQRELKKNELQFISYKYWNLLFSSVVRVDRDREWFATVVPKLYAFWEDVKKHRENGGKDIAPKKRKQTFVDDDEQNENEDEFDLLPGSICLLDSDDEF